MVVSLPDHQVMVDNVVNAWNHAGVEHVIGGREWYEAGHSYLVGLAAVFDQPIEVVVGICAVLSPSVNWDRNLLETHMLLDGELEGFTAYGNNVAKAWDIKDGDLSAIRGPKVEAFNKLLLNPNAHTVCIDTWAIRIACGLEEYNTVKGYTDRARIERIQQAYVSAAILLNEKPSHVQAVTWLSARGD